MAAAPRLASVASGPPMAQPTVVSGLPDAAAASAALRALQQREPYRPARAGGGAVVLYGAGQLGQLARAWCRQQKLSVLAVVDAAAERWRGHAAWLGTPVMSPDDVPALWRRQVRLLVCISTLPYAPLHRQLADQGWRRPMPFYDLVNTWPRPQPLNNGWHFPLPRPGSTGAATLETVLGQWHDDVSRAHHLQFLAWRCLREETPFEAAPILPGERYFIPELAPLWRPGERILDGGAHHGEFLDRWTADHPGWLDVAWAVEPDPINARVLLAWRDHCSAETRQRIHLHELALARRAARRAFIDGQGYASRLWQNGGRQVDVRPVDDTGWHPTFVKLHLEGGEWRALQGAQRTLQQDRPMLAVTVYHRRDGLWPVAGWLMRHLPDYRWLFRLHGWQGTAAVIYGLPVERGTGGRGALH